MPKALSNSAEPRALRLVPKCVIGIGSVDDFSQQREGWVRIEVMFSENGFERTLLAVMTEFDAGDVIRNSVLPLRNFHDFVRRHEKEFGLRVNKLPDEPRAG